MKQNSKEIVKWIKDRIFDVEQNCQLRTDDKDEYISIMSKCNEAIKFLDSLPDIEHRLARGGYIQDRNGNVCCEGDRVKVWDAFEHLLYKGTLVWDTKNELHFLIRSDEGNEHIALKDYMEKI